MIGVCKKNEAGHVWESSLVDPRRSCVHCGRPGRDNVRDAETGGFFAEATRARMLLFDGLRSPASCHGGKAK
jgi:hypothetical protein